MKNEQKNITKNLTVISSISVIAVTIVYLLLGFFTPDAFGPDNRSAFESFWVLYLLIPIITLIYQSIKTKRLSAFPFPLIIVFVYLSLGIFIGSTLWRYGWVSFLLIPIFYIVAREIDSRKCDTET